MSVIDDYLSNVEPTQKKVLEHVRQIIKKTVPNAEEVITYGIPGFKYNGKYLIAFAPFKNHMSLFPGASPTEKMKEKLKNYKLSKGTIQFTLDNPLPDDILTDIINLCVERNNG